MDFFSGMATPLHTTDRSGNCWHGMFPLVRGKDVRTSPVRRGGMVNVVETCTPVMVVPSEVLGVRRSLNVGSSDILDNILVRRIWVGVMLSEMA